MAGVTCEEQIKAMAAQGFSKQHVMDLLGFTRYSFGAVLELIGPIDWPGQGRSVANRAANRLRRGHFTEGLARAQALAAAARSASCKREVRGVVGSVSELVAAFGIKLHPTTVRRRMRDGMSLEEALFTPPSTCNNLGSWLGPRVTGHPRRGRENP